MAMCLQFGQCRANDRVGAECDPPLRGLIARLGQAQCEHMLPFWRIPQKLWVSYRSKGVIGETCDVFLLTINCIEWVLSLITQANLHCRDI